MYGRNTTVFYFQLLILSLITGIVLHFSEVYFWRNVVSIGGIFLFVAHYVCMKHFRDRKRHLMDEGDRL